jgi:selenide,water dikinase
MAERGAIPGGTRRNLESLGAAVTYGPGVDEVTKLMLADAQTSGGLLIAVAEAKAPALLAALQKEGTPVAVVIGRVVAGQAGTIAVS